MAARWRGELKAKLSLTPEQVQKTSPIINDAKTTFRATFAGHILATLSKCNPRIVVELTRSRR